MRQSLTKVDHAKKEFYIFQMRTRVGDAGYNRWAHDIVDNPNARKLQRVPVTVMGGVVVFAGIIVAGIVLSMRMLRGISPFHPDKTHLHHLFIDMGFSHLGAALFILFMNLGVVLLWFLSWRLGASIDVQTYLVVGLGLLVTFGFYGFMKRQQNGGPVDDEGYPQGTRLWHVMRRLGGFTHRDDRRFWRVMRHLMDEQLLCSKVKYYYPMYHEFVAFGYSAYAAAKNAMLENEPLEEDYVTELQMPMVKIDNDQLDIIKANGLLLNDSKKGVYCHIKSFLPFDEREYSEWASNLRESSREK